MTSREKFLNTQVKMMNSQEVRSSSCANSSFNADISSNINHSNINIMNAKSAKPNTITNDSDSDRP